MADQRKPREVQIEGILKRIDGHIPTIDSQISFYGMILHFWT